MRRVILALVLLSLPIGTWAGTHRAGAGGGAGGAWKSFLGGFIFTAEWTLRQGPEDSSGLHDWTFSLVGDYTHLSGDHNGDLTQHTAVGGLRYTRNFSHRFQPFVHGQVGGYWAEGRSSFAGMLGIGADVPFARFGDGYEMVIRGQLDYYWIDKHSPSYPQAMGLFVLRFE